MLALPWFNNAEPFNPPMLSLAEMLDLMVYEVRILRDLGITDGMPEWEREKLAEVADAHYLAEYLVQRFRKVDPQFTRSAFEQQVRTRGDLLALAARVAEVDAVPKGMPPGKGGTRGAATAGKSTRWKLWRRA